MSEKSTVEASTVNWDEQRPDYLKKPRSRFWPVVLCIFAALTICCLLSLVATFGIIGAIVELVNTPQCAPIATVECDEYGHGYGMGEMRGSQRRGCCDCGCCPNAGDPEPGRDYIEYYYEGEEGALPGERGGRVTIELDENGVHGQMQEGEIRITPDMSDAIPTPTPTR